MDYVGKSLDMTHLAADQFYPLQNLKIMIAAGVDYEKIENQTVHGNVLNSTVPSLRAAIVLWSMHQVKQMLLQNILDPTTCLDRL